MRPSPTSEPNPQSDQELRAAMMRRLGIADDAPPAAPSEPAQSHLKVVASAQDLDAPAPVAAEAATYEQQLEDMLSRFGIDEAPPARAVEPAPAPQAPRLQPVFVQPEPVPEPRVAPREEPVLVRTEPGTPRVAEFDIPATPLRRPEREPEPAPPPMVGAPAFEAPAAKQTQDEMLQELRRQLKGSRKAKSPRVAVPPIALPAQSRAQKRRKMGEMATTRLIIWVLALIAGALMTYNVVTASLKHERAKAAGLEQAQLVTGPGRDAKLAEVQPIPAAVQP